MVQHEKSVNEKPALAMAQFRAGIYAGIGVAASILAKQLDKNGRFELVPFYVGRSVEGHHLLMKILFQLNDLIAFGKILLTKRIDIVHEHSVLAEGALFRDFVIVAIARLLKSKIIVEYHGSKKALLSTVNPLFKWWMRYVFQNSDRIVLLSQEEISYFSLLTPYSRKLIMLKNPVAANGQDLEVSAAGGLQGAAKAKRLLFISRFDESKGIFDAIAALRILRDRGENCVLVLAGDGEERRKAEQMVRDFNLSKDVEFLGWVPEGETERHFGDSTLLVFPSYYYQEGFPMVILQALAAGLPIITTKYRAMADYLREPEHCLFVQQKNPADLAEKISYLLRHELVREQMRTNNKLLALQFAPQHVAGEFEELYMSLLEKRIQE